MKAIRTTEQSIGRAEWIAEKRMGTHNRDHRGMTLLKMGWLSSMALSSCWASFASADSATNSTTDNTNANNVDNANKNDNKSNDKNNDKNNDKPPTPESITNEAKSNGDELSTASEDAANNAAALRIGEPTPLTQREPLLKAGGVEVNIRYGLVGTGPTRFLNDIRYGVTDWLELRTSFAPLPSSIQGRFKLGMQKSENGALILDAGIAHFDTGLRVVPDSGEAQVGLRVHTELGLSYAKTLAPTWSAYASARLRSRFSGLENDEQQAIAVDGSLSYDIQPSLAVTFGLGYAQTLGTPVRELSINFLEIDRAGITHLLARDDGVVQSVTIPIALTYGRVENFDVDLFCTPRVYPEFGIVFGAGVRLRL